MILRHLYTGADRPSTLSEIAERAGITRRQAELAIRDARLAGEPILSGPRGMYLASNDAEAARWVERQRSRGVTLLETARAVERGIEARGARQGGFPWAA